MKRSLYKPRGYWTLERCAQEAIKYQSKSEWERNSRSSYQAAINSNWMSKCCEHMVPPAIELNRVVYVLVDHTKLIAYVGQTGRNPRIRFRRHIKEKPDLQDSYRLKTLDFIVHDERICTELEIKEQEAKEIEHWRSKGYRMLNIAPAGSLGGTKVKWTMEACAEAARGITIKELRKNFKGAYGAIIVNKWKHILLLCAPRKLNSKLMWTKEKIIESTRSYQDIKSWRKANSGAYTSAFKNGWLQDVHKARKWPPHKR